jgi:hypothetical protein
VAASVHQAAASEAAVVASVHQAAASVAEAVVSVVAVDVKYVSLCQVNKNTI